MAEPRHVGGPGLLTAILLAEPIYILAHGAPQAPVRPCRFEGGWHGFSVPTARCWRSAAAALAGLVGAPSWLARGITG
jgi:hypothetical protein